MQDFNIIRKVKVSNNFKNEKIKSIFDIDKDEIIYSKNHKLFYDEMKWNIGVIYGNSGSEKNLWNNESIINNFNGDVSEIIKFLSKVGLNTQLSYLKPYGVLSNGEKMRCDLARSIFENDFVIIDEYSSVVDRHIAKIISQCIRKVILEKNKKVIFISCHNDFLNDLMPDWVYNIDTQEFLKDLPFCKTKFKFYITIGNIFLNECCKEVYKTHKNIYISTSILTFARNLKKNKNFKQIKTAISSNSNKNKPSLNKTLRLSKTSFKYVKSLSDEP